ncbi:MAG: FGGY family carbohydrate kinase [Oscillospiraceae bacterium]|nr:FGGY family carbohydrate kinase [Oscillospiraceae bacterium]
MQDLILGIDIGTTSLKAAVYDCTGQQKSAAIQEYSLLTPETNMVEAPCDIYMHSIKKCLSDIRLKDGVKMNNITVIGFSVQGETLVFLDENGAPVHNAIVWMDTRASTQAEKLRAHFGDEKCYEITGQVSFEACWPASKIMWLRENAPKEFDHIRHILLLEDYIIYQLTGKIVAEGSLLTSTEYWDIRTKRYWKDMLDFIGIDEDYLPEIRESGESVGTILPAMARELGVSPAAVITTGCLDQAAGAIGVGNIKPGIFSENIGAALAICVPTAKLTYDPNRQMPVHYFALPDTYMMHTFTTGGMCLRWFRDSFCENEIGMQDKTGLDSYYLLDLEAAKIPSGSDGLITLPHLQGSMAPDVNLNAKGVFYGATLKHTRAHFIRSIMESLGYVICRNLEAIDAMGLTVRQIRTMGGGSKSDIWNQIKADITGKQLNVTYSSQDTACLGAAILAGKAVGVFSGIESAVNSMVKIKKTFEPNPANHEIYNKQYQKFKLLQSSLSELYKLDAK